MPEYQLLLREIRDEAPDVKSFIFEKPKDFNFVAGQFMTIFLDVQDTKGSYRQFSIASSPTESALMITSTMRGGAFKSKLAEMQGQKIKVRGPFGQFVLQQGGEHVMIAGGIGVTPFRSMIKFATDTEYSGKIKLLYSNKTPESITFMEDLDLFEKSNEHLEIVHTITQPDSSWQGRTGRVDEKMIRENTADLKTPVFYVCGPPAMVDGMRALLKGMNIPDERVKFEQFTGY